LEALTKEQKNFAQHFAFFAVRGKKLSEKHHQQRYNLNKYIVKQMTMCVYGKVPPYRGVKIRKTTELSGMEGQKS